MNKWKVYAIVMSLVSLGSLQESFRILTSDAPDIAGNRTSLIPIAVFGTGICVFLAVKFWRKSSKI